MSPSSTRKNSAIVSATVQLFIVAGAFFTAIFFLVRAVQQNSSVGKVTMVIAILASIAGLFYKTQDWLAELNMRQKTR